MQNVGQQTVSPQTNQLANLPASLRALPQWCLTVGSTKDKAPRSINGKLVSVTDRENWTDFETACRVAGELGWMVGFVLTADDPFTCIDMDVKPDTSPADLARFGKIADAFDSFTEQSRSGQGLHVWVEGNIGRGCRRDGVEVYSQERFIICTGNVLRDRPISCRPSVLGQLVSEMRSDTLEMIEMTGDNCPDFALADRTALDEGELGRLFRGEGWDERFPSQSEADLALVKLLLPQSDSPGECWETFKLSALGKRDKANRPDYKRRTLSLAAQHVANDASQVQHGKALADALFWKPTEDSRHYRLLRDKDLERQPRLRWLVKWIVPDSGIGAIYGDSGTFKSFLTLDLLAHIANGREWFGQRVRSAPAVYVPFEGQGGIPNRVKAWRLAQTQARLPDGEMAFAPAEEVQSNIAVIIDQLNLRERADRDKLVVTLTENGLASGVLCIDTLAHASAGIDENSSEMSEMIAVFRELQQRLGGVILLIHHSGKDASRGMRGWSGLHAAMDFVIECERDKKASVREAQFTMTKVKDGSDGRFFRFEAVQVALGVDQDGDTETSLTINPTGGQTDRSIDKSKPNAEQDRADDEFVWEWVKREVESDGYPSGRSLEGQRSNQMSQERKLTQVRLRDAIHRLRSASRLVDAEDKAPSGNTFMVAK